jgi:hypothetical protein
MTDTSQIPKTPAQALEAEPQKSLFQKYGLLIAFIVLIIVLALPTPKGLSIAGQRTDWYPALCGHHMD